MPNILPGILRAGEVAFLGALRVSFTRNREFQIANVFLAGIDKLECRSGGSEQRCACCDVNLSAADDCQSLSCYHQKMNVSVWVNSGRRRFACLESDELCGEDIFAGDVAFLPTIVGHQCRSDGNMFSPWVGFSVIVLNTLHASAMVPPHLMAARIAVF